MAQENETQKKALYGAGNNIATTPLTQGVAVDVFPNAINGMNKIRVEGYNGKGQMKDYGANPFNNADIIPSVIGTGNAVFVGKDSVDAKRFVISKADEPDTSYHIIFDMRAKEKPMAIFKKTLIDDPDNAGKKKYETAKLLSEKELVLIPKGDFTRNDLIALVTALGKSLRSIDAQSSGNIVTALNGAGLIKDGEIVLKDTEAIFSFIKVFDENLTKSEENIKALKTEVVVNAEISVPKGGFENLYQVFNPATLNGVKIATYSDAIIIKGTLDGTITSDVMGIVEKTFIEMNEDNKVTALELIEANLTYGVDANNNVVILQDSNVPYKSGGELHKTLVENLASESAKAKKVIDGAFWDKANKIDPQKYPRDEGGKTYSDSEIIQAEKTLQAEAEKYVSSLAGGEKDKEKLSKILGDKEPIITMMQSGSIEKMNEGKKLAQQLASLTRNAITMKAITADPEALVKDGYMKEGRQLGVANSSPYVPLEYNYKDGERMVVLSTDIPKLVKTVGEDEEAVVNLKLPKMPFMQIIVDKEMKAKDLQVINTMGAWTQQQKTGRVLKALASLNSNDEKLEKKLKDLVNFGGVMNDKQTDFGLGAVLKNESDNVAQYFKPFLSELRAIAYADNKDGDFGKDTLSKIQDKIANLSTSEDYSLQNLGKMVIALQERSNGMQDMFNKAGIQALRGRAKDDKSIEKREALKTMLIDAINGKKLEPVYGKELSIANTGAVVKTYFDSVVNNVDSNMLKVASNMGFAQDYAKSGKFIAETKEGTPYIKTTYYNENLLGAKDVEEIMQSVAEAPRLDFTSAKETMEANRAYYNENKVVFNNRRSLYKEDDNANGVVLELDDELQNALGDISKEAETAQEEQIDTAEMVAQAEIEASPDEAEGMVMNIELDGVDPSMFDDGITEEDEVTEAQREELEAISAQAVDIG